MERASETGGTARLNDALDSFRCCLDTDIEDFLRTKTALFLSRGWCSIYLIVDEEAFDAGKIQIDAYFTLSHKPIIPISASKSNIQKASGFKDSPVIPCVLIGQLGKYKERVSDTEIHSAPITSREILDFAFEVIRASSALIPCRCALVECSENEKVQQSYKNYGFRSFQFDGGHYQLIKLIH